MGDGDTSARHDGASLSVTARVRMELWSALPESRACPTLRSIGHRSQKTEVTPVWASPPLQRDIRVVAPGTHYARAPFSCSTTPAQSQKSRRRPGPTQMRAPLARALSRAPAKSQSPLARRVEPQSSFVSFRSPHQLPGGIGRRTNHKSVMISRRPSSDSGAQFNCACLGLERA